MCLGTAAADAHAFLDRAEPLARQPEERRTSAIHQLRRSSLVEGGLGIVIFVFVGILGSLPPGRARNSRGLSPCGRPLQISDIPAKVLIAVVMTAVGLFLVVTSLWLLRWLFAVAGLATNRNVRT